MYSVFILIFLYQGWLALTVNLIGYIDNDLYFYYREFSTFPSLEATIEYNITYNYTVSLLQCSGCYPKLDIYTTKSDANLDRNCSVDVFGQLRNENLHTPLKVRHRNYRFSNCTKDANYTQNGLVNCYGKTKIQDYIPRNYGFSFGHRCEQLQKGIKRSLRGLQYNMTIHSQTNETQCQSMGPVDPRTGMCARFYSHMSLPNLVGSPDLNYNKDKVFIAAKYYETFELEKCYPYFYELLCYVIFPKCDTETRTVIHPCKEMCEDLREGCTEKAQTILETLAGRKHIVHNWTLPLEKGLSIWFDCDYLPSKDGTVPCFYKPVICQSPSNNIR